MSRCVDVDDSIGVSRFANAFVRIGRDRCGPDVVTGIDVTRDDSVITESAGGSARPFRAVDSHAIDC